MKTRDEELRELIRLNLIDLRLKSGKSQEDVAIKIGRSRNAVGSWEQGLSLPDIETLHRLSIYYKKSMEYFLENKPENVECEVVKKKKKPKEKKGKKEPKLELVNNE